MRPDVRTTATTIIDSRYHVKICNTDMTKNIVRNLLKRSQQSLAKTTQYIRPLTLLSAVDGNALKPSSFQS